MYLFKLKNVSNIFSQLQTLKTKASGDRPDPRIVVSPRTLCYYSAYNSPIFQGAFLDTVIHPDSVDDRKGAVSFKFLSPPPSIGIQLNAYLVCCRVDTSVTASFLLLRCDGHVKLCRRNVVQHYSSRTSYGLCFRTPTRRLRHLASCSIARTYPLFPSSRWWRQQPSVPRFGTRWSAIREECPGQVVHRCIFSARPRFSF